MNRTRIIVVLLVLFCAAVIYAWVATPRQRSIAPGELVSRSATTAQPFSGDVSFTVADLDFSAAQADSFHPPKVDLFGSLYPPPKPEQSRPLPAPVKIEQPVPPPPRIAPVVTVPTGPKPIQPLTVLGFLNKAGQLTVFLSSTKGDVYLVKQGDVFADDLIVVKITASEIKIQRKNTDQQVMLRLGEVKSQRLPGLKLVSDRPKFTPPEPEAAEKEPQPDGNPEDVLKKEPKSIEGN